MGLLDLPGQIVSAATNPYGAASSGEWDLTEGRFTLPSGDTVRFFFESPKGESKTQMTGLEQISDSGGRRKVVYEYPYRDGQVLDDLGRKGSKFTFNIKFWGRDYETLFNQFLQVVSNNSDSGTLTHPVLGAIKCGFHEWEFIHRHDEFNAVTIRATFLEDSQDELIGADSPSPNSGLRDALQALTDVQATIGNAIFTVGAALLIPSAIQNAMSQRLGSITGQLADLLGQLVATFSTDSQLKSLAVRASAVTGGLSALTGGTVTSTDSSGQATTSTLPPVFQVGLSPADVATAQSLQTNFISANTITPQQAVYQMNIARASISAAITEVEGNYSSNGSDIVLNYRSLAITFQKSLESCISQTSASVKIYTVPYAMSVRMAAFLNGLSVDRQNDISNLNPSLDCLNFIQKGTQLVIPAV